MVEKTQKKASNIVELFSSQECELASVTPVSRFEHVSEQGFAYVQRNGASRRKPAETVARSFDCAWHGPTEQDVQTLKLVGFSFAMAAGIVGLGLGMAAGLLKLF